MLLCNSLLLTVFIHIYLSNDIIWCGKLHISYYTCLKVYYFVSNVLNSHATNVKYI